MICAARICDDDNGGGAAAELECLRNAIIIFSFHHII